MSISYKKSGVDYSLLDPIKVLAQNAGLETNKNTSLSKFREVTESRGESAYVIEGKDNFIAFVQEGLGTKNLVADEMRIITGKTYYDGIAKDTVAMIVNDLITAGAKPLVIQAYWAVGNSKWFNDRKRSQDLVFGWKKACDDAGVVWGGGETPTLKDVVHPDAIDLAGSACGIVYPKSQLVLGHKLREGDAIILFGSSGIHANGITLARKITGTLPLEYKTKLPSGKMYGEVLLTPTIIYAKLVKEFQSRGIDIHYMVNFTGHGWRKLMRANQKFTYMIRSLPPVTEIFAFIQKHSKLSSREMYATFNMGVGFAIYVAQRDVESVLSIAKQYKILAYNYGKVIKGPKKVVIEPLDITYTSNELSIR